MSEFTELLAAHNAGDPQAATRMFELVYADLRAIAQRQLGSGRDYTLSATGLVHESYLKLSQAATLSIQDRQHFIRTAATAMRQIAIDYARERATAKRGGNAVRLSLDEDALAIDAHAYELLELDDALHKLADVDQRLVAVVEYRYFAGLTESETAEQLDVTTRTVQRDWVRAKSWLAEILDPST